MAKITGIGGVFIKSKGKGSELAEWYKTNLGLDLESWGGAILKWPDDKAEDKGVTVWSAADSDTNPRGSPDPDTHPRVSAAGLLPREVDFLVEPTHVERLGRDEDPAARGLSGAGPLSRRRVGHAAGPLGPLLGEGYRTLPQTRRYHCLCDAVRRAQPTSLRGHTPWQLWRRQRAD